MYRFLTLYALGHSKPLKSTSSETPHKRLTNALSCQSLNLSTIWIIWSESLPPPGGQHDLVPRHLIPPLLPGKCFLPEASPDHLQYPLTLFLIFINALLSLNAPGRLFGCPDPGPPLRAEAAGRRPSGF